ncbi:MAG: type II toxin-antitoxin system HicB family antitoxin, partial [bacterium]|nr:type II toxin-antitoxin system HicB family antitoxin [bacterium]
MTTFIAIVRADNDGGYTASFPDFSGLVVPTSTLDEVNGKAREVLLRHIEGLIEAGERVPCPTPATGIRHLDPLLVA